MEKSWKGAGGMGAGWEVSYKVIRVRMVAGGILIREGN